MGKRLSTKRQISPKMRNLVATLAKCVRKFFIVQVCVLMSRLSAMSKKRSRSDITSHDNDDDSEPRAKRTRLLREALEIVQSDEPDDALDRWMVNTTMRGRGITANVDDVLGLLRGTNGTSTATATSPQPPPRPLLNETFISDVEKRIAARYALDNNDDSDYEFNVLQCIKDYVAMEDGVLQDVVSEANGDGDDDRLQRRIDTAVFILTRRLKKRTYVWALREAILTVLSNKTNRIVYRWCQKHAALNDVCNEMFRNNVMQGEFTLIQLNQEMARVQAGILETYSNTLLLGFEGSGLRGAQPQQKKRYNMRIAVIKAKLDRVMYAATVAYDHEKALIEYANVHSDNAFTLNKYTEAITFSFTHKICRAVMPQSQNKLSKYQTLLYSMLPRFMAEDLRYRERQSGNRQDLKNMMLYRERKTNDGKPTYTWEPYTTIQQFLNDKSQTVRGGDNSIMDLLTAQGGNAMAKAIIEFLTNGEFYALPRLVKDRYVFSFQNGIYYVRENRFYKFVDGPRVPAPVACNYINTIFDPAWVGDEANNPVLKVFHDRQNVHTKKPIQRFMPKPNMTLGTWRNIETPLMDSILEHQGIANRRGQNVLDWWYILTGRMLYDLGEFDNWQVVLFLLGHGGTGKSTLAQFVMSVYDTTDTNNIANQTETTFGLASYTESFMNVGLDINKKFRMDACDFKSIAAAEPVQVREKFKTAEKRLLQGSWMFIANEFPGWDEKGDSVERRLALFLFNVEVKNDSKDTGLLDRMRNLELAKFIVKANRAYREMVTVVGERDVHSVWPKKYFEFNTQRLRAMINPLGRFLCDKDYVYRDPKIGDQDNYNAATESSLYCPMDVFKKAYLTYCEHRKVKGETWTPLFYEHIMRFYHHPFDPKGKKGMQYPRHAIPGGAAQRSIQSKRVFYGLDLVQNLSNMERREAGLPAYAPAPPTNRMATIASLSSSP